MGATCHPLKAMVLLKPPEVGSISVWHPPIWGKGWFCLLLLRYPWRSVTTTQVRIARQPRAGAPAWTPDSCVFLLRLHHPFSLVIL